MIKYGTHVAFLQGGAIFFGFVSAVIERTDSKGQTKQFVVTSIGADGTANSDTTINEEELLADLESWNKADELFTLARGAHTFKWAQQHGDAAKEPPASANELSVVTTESPDAAGADAPDGKHRPI